MSLETPSNQEQRTLQIWVDADACPVVIREIICRAAERTKTQTTFVANQAIKLPNSRYLSMLQVEPGFDVADDTIVQRTHAGDIIITSDIPLAAEILDKDGLVLTARGQRYTKDNIKARLNMRDFMETMRASGIQSGGPPALNHSDRQNFANALDRLLTAAKK
ncbi:MAG: YaiI/YqxD family protein [Cellvibrionaceae bacterium]